MSTNKRVKKLSVGKELFRVGVTWETSTRLSDKAKRSDEGMSGALVKMTRSSCEDLARIVTIADSLE